MEAATWGIIDFRLESTIQSPIQLRMEWLPSPSPAVVARSCATASVTVAVIQRFIALRSPRLVIDGPHTEGVGCGPCPENTEVCGSESRPATMVRSEARGKVVPPILVSMSVIRSSCERMRCHRRGQPKSRGGADGTTAARRSPISLSP